MELKKNSFVLYDNDEMIVFEPPKNFGDFPAAINCDRCGIIGIFGKEHICYSEYEVKPKILRYFDFKKNKWVNGLKCN